MSYVCPNCSALKTHIVDSRPRDNGAGVRRRRKCTVCGHRFSTMEIPLEENPDADKMRADLARVANITARYKDK
jgi:transcriptional regulator NrdR family protein